MDYEQIPPSQRRQREEIVQVLTFLESKWVKNQGATAVMYVWALLATKANCVMCSSSTVKLPISLAMAPCCAELN